MLQKILKRIGLSDQKGMLQKILKRIGLSDQKVWAVTALEKKYYVTNIF